MIIVSTLNYEALGKMKSPGLQRLISVALKIVFVSLAIYVPAVRAQDPQVQQLTAPPPLRIISRDERAKLDAENDSKDRLRETIALADAHLAKAQEHTTQHDYDSAAKELGNYGALLDDALALLRPMSRDRNKTRDLYKRLELALRAQGPRLTAMRRTTPLEYAVWIKEVEDFARKGRTEALNSFYGHTVFREGNQKPIDEKRALQPPNDAAKVPENKP